METKWLKWCIGCFLGLAGLVNTSWAICEQEEKVRIEATLQFLATECSEFPSNTRCKDSQTERLRKINEQIKNELYNSRIGWAPATERQKLNDADRKTIASIARFQYIKSREVSDRAIHKHFTAEYLHRICLREAPPQTHPSAINRINTDANNQSGNNSPSENNNQSSNSAQQQPQATVTQAQNRAREAQQRGDADAQRRGRRVHDPAAEAHDCIQPNFGGLYGGMVNSCNQKVWYTYCGFRPNENSWLRGIMDCEMQKFGMDSVGPNRESASHTKGVQSIHWFACKDPAWPLDVTFDGTQIQGRCRVVGGN